MIVRNEANVVARCLDSIRHWVDYWVIVDTGSVDRTEQAVANAMSGIPGEFHRRVWKDFAHNRNQALRLTRGRGDYVLIIDADEELVFDPDFRFPDSHHDCYRIKTCLDGVTYLRRSLLWNDLDWFFEGVVHEQANCAGGFSEGVLDGVINVPHRDGARSLDPDKYNRDAALLEEQLRREPDNSRCVFYLAQSYRDAGDYRRALQYYGRRSEMSGSRDEIWYSLYQVGCMQEQLGYEYGEVIRSHSKAFEYSPERAEPLRRIALMLGLNGEIEQARDVSILARSIPIPVNGFHVDLSTYTTDWLDSDIRDATASRNRPE